MKAFRLPAENKLPAYFIIFYIVLFLFLLSFFLFLRFPIGESPIKDYIRAYVDARFFIFLAVGFIAQLIDGSLGMAYGISSTTFLLTTGVSPAVASASVHLAEIFTTAVSGIAHWRFGNVDRELFKQLALPGIIGALLGASLVSYIDGDAIKPYISSYLLIMGSIVLIKGLRNKSAEKKKIHLPVLGFLGGFADSSGGGGWGPIVTTTLLSGGNTPRTTIGTVNAVEFLVAVAASGIFTIFIGITAWPIIVGLILGGILAAPPGAWMAKSVNQRFLLILVGCVIILLSAKNLFVF
jgi:uncharacterized membrane protein YfcA